VDYDTLATDSPVRGKGNQFSKGKKEEKEKKRKSLN
jgi:hypothetical protein